MRSRSWESPLERLELSGSRSWHSGGQRTKKLQLNPPLSFQTLLPLKWKTWCFDHASIILRVMTSSAMHHETNCSSIAWPEKPFSHSILIRVVAAPGQATKLQREKGGGASTQSANTKGSQWPVLPALHCVMSNRWTRLMGMIVLLDQIVKTMKRIAVHLHRA